MTLTSPVAVADIRTAFPRDARGMEDAEIGELLRIEERALRSLPATGVSDTSADTDAVLKDAMIAGWPSFVLQVRQIASEDAGTDGHKVLYNRAGVVDFTWPSLVVRMMESIADTAPDAESVGGYVRHSASTPIVFGW